MKAISCFLSHDGIVLDKLNLGNNNFGDKGCVHLVEGLKKNKSLKRLSLGTCKITGEGMETISSFLSQDGTILEELDLSFNRIGDEGFALLVEGLKKNKSLKKLHIFCCDLSAEGMKAISSFLSQDEIVLEELGLLGNGEQTTNDKDLHYIGEILAANLLARIKIFIESTCSFKSDLKIWRNEFVPLFISRCELLCFTQDIINSQDSLFHFLGVCLYDIAELLVPCFKNEEDQDQDQEDYDDDDDHDGRDGDGDKAKRRRIE
eukprot:TRINITY_DN2290_c0_g1_i6.p1 TRINITY_DN2290_c0_g1~~TRINITY_DN2290_c0_g1_i6.p1  ORF type:complete len:262 (-),score=78.42 TRINITY_DN2290_c0_g1_i6:44-829(-)